MLLLSLNLRMSVVISRTGVPEQLVFVCSLDNVSCFNE